MTQKSTQETPQGPSENLPLGILTKLPTPNTLQSLVVAGKRTFKKVSDPALFRVDRFYLQAQVSKAVPSSRTASVCMRSIAHGHTNAGVKYSQKTERARYCNLQVCGSVWSCPVCSANISEERRKNLVALVDAHKKTGGVVLLVTRTFPHKLSDRLDTLLKAFAEAENKNKSGKSWELLVERHGIVGSVRSVEVTYGKNGWHVHSHELTFFDSVPADLERLRFDLFSRWSSACMRAGLPAPSQKHGVDVRDGQYAAAYASKWGLESELTKSHAKSSKDPEVLSPFDFLRVIGYATLPASVEAAKTLFHIYSTCFKGKRQLVYSKGLRERYELGDELSDEEAASLDDPEDILLGLIGKDDWSLICNPAKGIDYRGYLLELISVWKGDWAVFYDFIAALRNRTPLPPLSLPSNAIPATRDEGQVSEFISHIPEGYYNEGHILRQFCLRKDLPFSVVDAAFKYWVSCRQSSTGVRLSHQSNSAGIAFNDCSRFLADLRYWKTFQPDWLGALRVIYPKASFGPEPVKTCPWIATEGPF